MPCSQIKCLGSAVPVICYLTSYALLTATPAFA